MARGKKKVVKEESAPVAVKNPVKTRKYIRDKVKSASYKQAEDTLSNQKKVGKLLRKESAGKGKRFVRRDNVDKWMDKGFEVIEDDKTSDLVLVG